MYVTVILKVALLFWRWHVSLQCVHCFFCHPQYHWFDGCVPVLEKTKVKINLSLSHPQVASLSSPMPEWRTVPSSSATMASATCVVTPGLRSCRSHARVTSSTDLTPSDWLLPRWPQALLGSEERKVEINLYRKDGRKTLTVKVTWEVAVW